MSSDLRPVLERARRRAPHLDPALEQVHDRRDRRARNRRITATLTGLAITAAIIGSGLYAVRQQQGPARRTHTLHPAAGPTVDLSMAPGEYDYERRAVYTNYQPGAATDRIETWLGIDGSGRVVQGHDDRTFSAGEFPNDSSDLATLSTDPVALEQQLRDRLQPGGASPEPYRDWTYSPVPSGPAQEGPITWGLVRSTGDLLNERLTPELEAAVFQVLSSLQGVQVDRNAIDPAGRPAVEVTIETEYILHQWWFDPGSEQLLASRESDPAGRDGWYETIVQRAGIAASTDSADLTRSFIPQTDQAPPVSS